MRSTLALQCTALICVGFSLDCVDPRVLEFCSPLPAHQYEERQVNQAPAASFSADQGYMTGSLAVVFLTRLVIGEWWFLDLRGPLSCTDTSCF